jgi:hypothetical protein
MKKIGVVSYLEEDLLLPQWPDIAAVLEVRIQKDLAFPENRQLLKRNKH